MAGSLSASPEQPIVPVYSAPPAPLSLGPLATASAVPVRRRAPAYWALGIVGVLLLGGGVVTWMWVFSALGERALPSPALSTRKPSVSAIARPEARVPEPAVARASASRMPAAPTPTRPAEGIVEAQVNAPSCQKLLEDRSSPGQAASVRAQLALATALIRSQELDEAQRVYCRLVETHANNARPRVALIELLLARHDNLAALGYLKESVRTFPYEPRFRWMLGDALARTGDWSAARATWLELAAAVPGSEERRARKLAKQSLNLARANARSAGYDKAERAFRRAAILNPGNVEASTGVAQMLLQAGDPKAAAAWAALALRNAPRAANLHVLLGNALVASGDERGAQAAWQEALKINPGHREALARMRNPSGA
jgi:tetratricopeptide (TPR) repeat protein